MAGLFDSQAGGARREAFMLGDIDQARVHGPEVHETGSLFHPDEISVQPGRAPADICAQIGLNWLAARQLYADGWLSFDPAESPRLTAPQEAELTFVGRLVVAGCDQAVLTILLADLRKPYAYRLDRLYYDWEAGCWEILPRYEDVRGLFQEWLEDLVDSGQLRKLHELRERLDNSIRDLQRLLPW